MASQRAGLLQCLCSVLLLVGVASALKFDLTAHSGHESIKKERCIRNFVNKETLVVVTATIGGYKGDGMVTNIHVRSNLESWEGEQGWGSTNAKKRLLMMRREEGGNCVFQWRVN